jgi:hypothetical protein
LVSIVAIVCSLRVAITSIVALPDQRRASAVASSGRVWGSGAGVTDPHEPIVTWVKRYRVPLFAAGLVAVTAVVAAVVVVVARGGEPAVTREDFLAQVHDVCAFYGEQLDAVQPPVDLSSPGAVYESLGAALPLLRQQAAAVRALDSPPALRDDLDEFFRLTDTSLAELKEGYDQAGARELFLMATALTRFEEARDEAKAVATRIGFDC